MLANTTYDRAKAVADEIAELPHVTGVTFDDSTAHFVSSAALLTVSFDGDETERFPTEYDALIEALAKSIVEISSSSLTTIAGLVALMLMQFRLGYDLGLVLSKSIVCSLITVFLLMPGLIAYCRKPLRVTAHRSHIPKLYGWGRFLMKTKLGFLVILPMAVYCSSRTEYAFSDSSIDELVHSESRATARSTRQPHCVHARKRRLGRAAFGAARSIASAAGGCGRGRCDRCRCVLHGKEKESREE